MKAFTVFMALLLPVLPLHAELRTFKNSKGEEIKAEILDATDARAELKREDGKKFFVALTSLSEADQKWIAEWRKTHKRFKVEVSAAEKKGNSRAEKGDAFAGKEIKGNDCWYVLTFTNKTAELLAGLRIEYVLFAPAGATVPRLCGVSEVPNIPAGKAGQVITEKLFAEQSKTVIQSGNSSTVRFTESTLAGIHAELILAGKPAGTFVSGKVPDDAAAQLQQWREKQQPEKGKEG